MATFEIIKYRHDQLGNITAMDSKDEIEADDIAVSNGSGDLLLFRGDWQHRRVVHVYARGTWDEAREVEDEPEAE